MALHMLCKPFANTMLTGFEAQKEVGGLGGGGICNHNAHTMGLNNIHKN